MPPNSAAMATARMNGGVTLGAHQRPKDLGHAGGGGRHQDGHEVADGLLTPILNRR